MRAKRSKKYRKIMSSYNLHFSFRTPYQILCDSHFLRNCHSFHMPIQKFLGNTLHGDSTPFVTQCSLASIMDVHRRKFAKELKNDGTNNNKSNSGGGGGLRGRGDGKPAWLPPPTEVPLRYCKHKDAEGKARGVLSEEDCLLDLVSGQVHGNEVPRNKQHYVLATAESEEEQKTGHKRRGGDLREKVRVVPGVPIVYVKRSVMILEELSGSSERVIRGVEKEKFKEGLVGAVRGVKRKREGDGDDSSDEDEAKKKAGGSKVKILGRAKGPNPLSVKKKKVKVTTGMVGKRKELGEDGEKKSKNRRKRGNKHKAGDGDGGGSGDGGQNTQATRAPASVAVAVES